MKIKCLKCGNIIEGDKKGNLIHCKCKECSIDENEYIARVSGNPDFISVIDSNGEEQKLITEPKKVTRLSKENYYLGIAEAVSKNCTCLKRRYGAVIVKNNEIISTGYNGSPRGMYSCIDGGKCNREDSLRGTDYNKCLSVHAEQNAIISASRQELIDSSLYLVGLEISHDDTPDKYVENASPCSLCKRMIINAGIKYVYVRDNLTNFRKIDVKDWNIDDIIGGY